MAYSFQVGIYLWPPPFLFTTLMYIIFKWKILIGINQKFICRQWCWICAICCLRLFEIQFKTIWNELPVPWQSSIFRGFNIICKWYLIQRPCRWRLSCHCITCCLSVPFYILMFLHVWDLYFFILSTISRLEPVTLIQDFQRGKSW